MIDRELRLRSIKKRLLLQVAFALLLNLLFVAALFRIQGPAFIAAWMRIVVAMAVIIFLPLLIVARWNCDHGPPRRLRHVGIRPAQLR